MLETFEATIDPFGKVSHNKKIRLDKVHRAFVTILDEEPPEAGKDTEWDLEGSAILLSDDLEGASQRISDEINEALKRSAEQMHKED